MSNQTKNILIAERRRLINSLKFLLEGGSRKFTCTTTKPGLFKKLEQSKNKYNFDLIITSDFLDRNLKSDLVNSFFAYAGRNLHPIPPLVVHTSSQDSYTDLKTLEPFVKFFPKPLLNFSGYLYHIDDMLGNQSYITEGKVRQDKIEEAIADIMIEQALLRFGKNRAYS